MDISKSENGSNGAGAAGGDPTIPQTFSDVKEKAVGVGSGGNQAGKKRGPYKKHNPPPVGDSPAPARPATQPVGGFTEPQIKTAFQGFHAAAALATNCNVWFLGDVEADTFVPSATLALNQLFPEVAQSKWGALSLAAVSYSFVLISKTLLFAEYKRKLKEEAAKEQSTPQAS